MARWRKSFLTFRSIGVIYGVRGVLEPLLFGLRGTVPPLFRTKRLIFCHVLSTDAIGVNLSPTLRGSKVPPLTSVPLPLEVGPLNQARGFGERCKLPQWGLGRIPSRQRFWCILRVKERCWWHSSDYRFCSVARLLWGSKPQRTLTTKLLWGSGPADPHGIDAPDRSNLRSLNYNKTFFGPHCTGRAHDALQDPKVGWGATYFVPILLPSRLRTQRRLVLLMIGSWYPTF